MKTTNLNLALYNQICEIYFEFLEEQIMPELEEMGIEIKTMKDEKKHLRPRKYSHRGYMAKGGSYSLNDKKTYEEVLDRLDMKGYPNHKVTIEAGSFSGTFRIASIMSMKYEFEQLISRSDYRYYVKERTKTLAA